MGHLETYRRRLQSTTAVIDDDDILIEILLRLSTKSIIQLKSVCKRWRSLISGHYFSVLHTIRHATTTAASALILQPHQWRHKYHYISLPQPNRSIKTPFTLSGHVIQSCHGLLLCSFTTKFFDFYIYNLATRVYRILNVECAEMRGLAIAFDPSHYKLIRVKFLDYMGEESVSDSYYQIDAFDSKSSSWSTVIEKFIGPTRMQWFNGIYWSNAIHWKVLQHSVYVDLDKGVFSEAHVSAIYWRRYSQCYIKPLLVGSGGYLHFIIHDFSQCSIFELEKDYSTWSIKYHVEYGGIKKALPSRWFLDCIIRAQSEERSFLLFCVPGKLMAYYLDDESLVELIQLRKEGCRSEHVLALDGLHQFVPTLAPV